MAKTKVYRNAFLEAGLAVTAPRVFLAEKISGENIADDIMGSLWCINCYPKKRVHAYFITNGMSLCEKHFKKLI